jgi:hypothetical protein
MASAASTLQRVLCRSAAAWAAGCGYQADKVVRRRLCLTESAERVAAGLAPVDGADDGADGAADADDAEDPAAVPAVAGLPATTGSGLPAKADTALAVSGVLEALGASDRAWRSVGLGACIVRIV